MNNYLKRIELNGYKSCRSVAVGFKPLKVMIGGNGAGKSNFLSIFRLLKALRADGISVCERGTLSVFSAAGYLCFSNYLYD